MKRKIINIEEWTFEKGQYLQPEWCEAQIGLKRDNLKYSLALMALGKKIEKWLWKNGQRWTVATEDFGIKVLSDADASVYNNSRLLHHFGGMLDRHDHAINVDVTQLEEDARAKHDRQLSVNGAMLSAAITARKTALKCLPHVRTTPTIESI
jgi:hypothetical protein